MTLDEVEATVWERLTAMTSGKITQAELVDAVLNAACDYAVHHAATADTPANVHRRRLEIADADPTNPARKATP